LEKALSAVHREIDIVTTPCGDPVAMVHCNSCTTDFDAWVAMFGSLLSAAGSDMGKGKLYDLIYSLAAKGDPNCGRVMNGAEEYGLRDVPEKLIVLACSISISVIGVSIIEKSREYFRYLRLPSWTETIGASQPSVLFMKSRSA
jgi:hypothetical protein